MSTPIIPIIDFSAYLNGNEESKQKVAMEIGIACEQIGFFIIKGHGVDKNIINNAWQSTWNCKYSLYNT